MLIRRPADGPPRPAGLCRCSSGVKRERVKKGRKEWAKKKEMERKERKTKKGKRKKRKGPHRVLLLEELSSERSQPKSAQTCKFAGPGLARAG